MSGKPNNLAVILTAIALVAGCATKTAPPLPPTPKYPDFVYPTPVTGCGAGVEAIDRGWRFLQDDDLPSAEREFAGVLKSAPDSAAAKTGEGYVALARHDYTRALERSTAPCAGRPPTRRRWSARG